MWPVSGGRVGPVLVSAASLSLLFTPLVLFAYLGGEKKTSVWTDMGQALRGQRSWTDLGFLLLCEVIFDVEGLPDLLGGLSFDHVGHCLTGDVQQAFNVQVIGRLKEKAKEAVLKLLPEHYEFSGYFCGNSTCTSSSDALTQADTLSQKQWQCHVWSSIRRTSGQSD